jgi:hypothetical protein
MKFLTTLILVLIASTAFAVTPFTKLGFLAYSTAAGTTCTVFASSDKLPVDPRGNYVQAIKPDANLSRSFNLKTKGFANYSTTYGYPANSDVQPMQFTFTCTVTNSSTLAPVKVYLNGIQTYFLTLSTGTFGGGW